MKSELIGMDKCVGNADRLAKLNKTLVRVEASLPAARVIYKGAYRRCPYDSGRKKGKHLRDAIFIDAREHLGKTDVLVGVNRRRAPHAHLIEFGWSRKPAGHPFLRPAVVEDASRSKAEFEAGIDKVIEQHIS